MPHVTFIYASIGRMLDTRFLRSWQMQPLAIARLAALTPKGWDVAFFDDRIEPIDYNIRTDLVAISVETYSASRAYQISAKFRGRGIPVVFGGFHATLCPDDALEHSDAICLGEAEPVWADILADVAARKLKRRYDGRQFSPLNGQLPDRRIFAGKNYLPLALIETSRGCPMRCNFCSITSFYQATYRRYPVARVVEEIRQTGQQNVFFVDDNLTADLASAKELFQAITPLKISWLSQAGLNTLKDRALVRTMAKSGCIGLLIGFESLEPENLASMGKPCNRVDEYREIIHLLREENIFVYGTFIFGYPHDTPASYARSLNFARQEKLFLCAFNPLVPFPGTPLYDQLKADGRMRFAKWWMDESFRFGQTPFEPQRMTPEQIEECCYQTRCEFYRPVSIFQRGLNCRSNSSSVKRFSLFMSLNLLARREVRQRRRLPIGARLKETS